MLGRELPRIAIVTGIRKKIKDQQEECWQGIGFNDRFFTFLDKLENSGNSGDFSYSKNNQFNSNITKWDKKGKNARYCHYTHYENEQVTSELLNNDFENLGGGECEGCHEQKGDLWSVKIGNKEAGFCIDCVKDAIEQEREKKEGGAEEEDGNLKTLIKSFVITASNRDGRGAMVVALVNRLAIDRGYEKEEVKAQIDNMIHEEMFIASEDDQGTFIKINGR
jgi:hypothetical protein